MGDGTSGNADADDEEAASSGFQRIVWLRQMLHRWQTSSGGTTATRSSSATGDGDGERGNDDRDDASTTDRTDNNDAAAGSRSARDPPGRRPPRVVEERCPDDVGGGGGGSPMTPDAPAGVPRGCCPVYVGLLPECRRRFVVPTAYLGMPVFRRLLEKAEEEYEFHYGAGGVTIPCDTEAFEHILLVLERHRQGLVDDDEGNAEDGGGHGGSSPEGQAQPITSSAADGGAKATIVHAT